MSINTMASKKYYRESELLAAAHILMSLTKGKSNEQIAVDFDNNLEFVQVWVDYMIGAKWMYEDADGKCNMMQCNVIYVAI